MDTLGTFLNTLASFVPAVAGAAVLIAAVVDGLKRAHIVPDGYAPLAASIINVVIWVLAYFAGPAHAADVQNVLSGLTLIAPVVLGLFVTAIAAPKAHDALTSAGVGFSHPDSTPVA